MLPWPFVQVVPHFGPHLRAPSRPAPFKSVKMSKRTKKVGISGKYGTRYGASLRKLVKKQEVSQHAKYTCTFCGKSGFSVAPNPAQSLELTDIRLRSPDGCWHLVLQVLQEDHGWRCLHCRYPCCRCDAVNSPPSPRNQRGLDKSWACFCFRVWCHGKGQRRLCGIFPAVGYGGSINDSSLSNDNLMFSDHDVTCFDADENRTGTEVPHSNNDRGKAAVVAGFQTSQLSNDHDTCSLAASSAASSASW
ncbi:hypothetical protein VTH06DRAFT_3446 [Thermothelomyces fergusii]